jgi:hypothetical protein
MGKAGPSTARQALIARKAGGLCKGASSLRGSSWVITAHGAVEMRPPMNQAMTDRIEAVERRGMLSSQRC